MANDLNMVALVGRLTHDAELKYGTNGSVVCRFSIAVNRRRKNGDDWEDEASFIDCILFGKSAESMNQYLTKGRQVSISGELHQSRWTQDGQPRSRVEVYVNSVQLLGGVEERKSCGFNKEESGPEKFEDDIPF
jgi:single-strand DNA-binding protein